MTFQVLISDPLNEDGIKPLIDADHIEVHMLTNLSKAELLERIPEYDALIVRSQTKVTEDVIEKGERLKVIGRAGVGVDNIDLDAATERGIVVVNSPDGNTNSAAEHTMAMLMALARNIPQAHASIKNHNWDRKSFVGVELKDKILGIIGLGRIGTEVAYRARGQRLKVIAYDPYLTEEKAKQLGVQYGTLDDVLRKSDFITIHTPLLKETRHILSAGAFRKMKDGVQILNCARGGLIDEDALYRAIKSKKVRGAALDVFEEEPVKNYKLLDLPEVIATPHLGASTVEAQENVAVDVSYDVIRILNGGLPQNPVNIPSVSAEVMEKIEPYFNLSEKLGRFIARMTEEPIEEVTVRFSGSLTELDISPLTRNAVKGMLKPYLGEHVNDVNAPFLASRKGITINESKTSRTKGFTNLITIEVQTRSSAKTVAGTLLNGLGTRIVKIDNYSVDVMPEGNLLLIRHKDQPGAIGRVGSLLGQYDVNIATMQVGRSNVGGDAIMVLTIDKPIDKECLDDLRNIPNIMHVIPIEL
ncbi:D-3-phosphoglycerate dehydrogenase [Melghiribacillus thermohalophilus]|uniref:D-3-phosphoglycerate dehydrogenase n=1 Tax=Melghiribacillus thermohalophilus TaxID=1324956 RepID=A0A4R3N888_9BACI|nr:phosphoglycerate dehydrogenase [Melghiribacillus thermohalophilus]TCT23313.1 D-3-phosphoglycerate dehydrogenase [Melghiribacillus thermohalophilus]